MISNSRTSGIEIIGNIPWGTHFCHFYQTKEDLMDILIPYIKAGLKNNEFCLWIISGQLDVEEAKKALKVSISDIEAYIQNGQVEIIPYTYWHLEEDTLDPQTVLNHLIEKTSKALASGYDGLRYSGNNLFDHEKLLDSIIGKYPMIALCNYPIDKYSALDIIEIATNHQFAVGKKKGKWEKIESSSQKNNKECKQVETALNMSEESFRALVMASSEMVYRVSPDWSEMRYFYGRGFLANTESPNPTWLNEYVLPEDQPRVTAIINGAIRTKSTYQTEHRVRLADGSLGWIFSRAVPLLDENGEIVEWLGAASDITKRKEAEDKLKATLDNLDKLVKERTIELQKAYDSLKKSEKSLAEAQEIAHIGSWERDFATNELHWSDETYRIFGLKPQESRIDYNTFLSYVHPEDRDRIDNAIKKALHGNPFGIDYRITLANGKERMAHEKAEVIFDEKKNPVRVIGTVQDITEHRKAEEKLRESEEKYRNIVETSNEGIYLVDDEAKITYANKIMETSGYTLEEIIGRPIWDFISEKSMPVAKRSFEKRKQGINDSYELKLLRKDGSFIWGLISAKSLFNKEGKFIGYLGMLTDITQRKQAEEVLANLETARKKEIHHRIKNNLQVISSLLDLQAEQFKNRECIGNSEVLEAFRES